MDIASIYAQGFDAEEFRGSAEARANSNSGFDYFGYASRVTNEDARELMMEVDVLSINLAEIKGMCNKINSREKSNTVQEMYESFSNKAVDKRIEILSARDNRLKQLTEMQK